MARSMLVAVLFVSTIILFTKAAPSEEKRQSQMIRLSGGCSENLEVYSDAASAWAQAADRDFGVNEARVVCRQLNCPTGTVTRTNTQGTTNAYQAFGYTCNGNEAGLDQCRSRGAVVSSQYGIAVMCSGAATLFSFSVYMLSLISALFAAYFAT